VADLQGRVAHLQAGLTWRCALAPIFATPMASSCPRPVWPTTPAGERQRACGGWVYACAGIDAGRAEKVCEGARSAPAGGFDLALRAGADLRDVAGVKLAAANLANDAGNLALYFPCTLCGVLKLGNSDLTTVITQ